VEGRAQVGMVLLGAAIGLGLMGDVLFHDRPLGVNVALWAVAFVAALAALLRIGHVPLHQGRRLMIAPLLLFAALLAWHDSPLLNAVNLFAIGGAVALGALRRTGRPVVHAQVDDYVAGAVTAGAATIVGGVELMQREVPWDELKRGVQSRRVIAVARGAALSLPFLALFAGLFAAADAVFQRLLSSATPALPHTLWQHVVLASVVAWGSAGLLRDLLAVREEDRVVSPRSAAPGIGVTELSVALGALNVLFLVFVLVQLRYLFGGQALVEADVGLTYSEYARHGFFELVAVAALVLVLLLGVDAVLKRPSRTVRALCGGLVALVLVVVASALQRLWLYQQQLGLTELRIYTTGVALWLAVVFLWLAATVLRGRRHLFATGAVLAGFVATLAINVLNPDALIARTNLSRPNPDVYYLGTLSDDAVPTLLARVGGLEPPLRQELARALLARSAESESLLSWNASRAHAAALIDQHRDELRKLAR
jgi:hypothetical protein